MDKPRHIVVVGAGPGGLTAAMLLARRGFRVTVLERKPHVGGRNAPIRLGGFTFDTGPTFLMLKHILDEVFEESGHRSSDFMEFTRLDPMYRLVFDDFSIEMSEDRAKMREQIARHFPGQEKGLDRYYRNEGRRYERVYPCLQKDYSSAVQMVNPALVKAVPRLSLGRTLFGVLGDYFSEERLRLAFTFQAKYLGMSPWHCPGAFAILSYVEHAYGVWHVKGGLSVISESMAKAAQANGADLRLGAPVKSLLLEGRRTCGVVLEGGEEIRADEVVLGADFGHAMSRLVPPGALRKYSPGNLARKKLSCSTFMLYLGLDFVPKLPHHTIVFAHDYRANTENIFLRGGLADDISFYVRNASVTDPTLAPAGKSAIYVLVPVPNRNAPIDWPREGAGFRGLVLRRIAERIGLSGLEGHIEQERVITPADWEDEWAVYRGATFNLSHSLDQMLYLRPRNRFEELDNTWLVGGGTHPGSGLPTIYESGRITANMISGKYGVEFRAQTPLADVRQ